MSKPGDARHLPDDPVVLDASFLIALLDGEDTAQRFIPVLTRGVVPAVTAGEVFYKLHATAGIDPAQIEDGLRALGIDLVDHPVAPQHATSPPSKLSTPSAASKKKPPVHGRCRPSPWETSAAWATPPRRGCRYSPVTDTGPPCNHWGYR